MEAENNFSYTDAMSKIQKILEKMESQTGQTDIDRLIQDVELASDLIVKCKKKLFNAEAKIQKILDRLDEDAGGQS